jgi:hypothetical protein
MNQPRRGDRPLRGSAARYNAATLMPRRLPRILLNAATVVSLALCVATALAWITGAEFGAGCQHQGQLIQTRTIEGTGVTLGTAGPDGFRCDAWYFGSGDGGFHLYRLRQTLPPGNQTFLTDYRPGWAPTGQLMLEAPPAGRSFGFAYWTNPVTDGRTRHLVVPHGPLITATAPLPVWWIWRLLRAGRRRRTGHCPACDYDLRATPARCPECGHTPGPPPAASPHRTPPAA